MTCVECGAEMGTASACATCGAPVPEHLLDKARDRAPRQDTLASPPSNRGGCLLAIINSVAGIALFSVVATYITQGSPAHVAQQGQDYMSVRLLLTVSIPSAAVMALSVLGVAARSRVRHVRERRALAYDAPEPLPEKSG